MKSYRYVRCMENPFYENCQQTYPTKKLNGPQNKHGCDTNNPQTKLSEKGSCYISKTIRLVGKNKSKHEMKQAVLLNQLSDSILELNKKDPSKTWKLTNLASVSLAKSVCHRIKNRQRNYKFWSCNFAAF